MRIAVACQGLTVAPYFVQSTGYMCYNVDRGIISDSRNMPAFDQGADKFVELLKSLEIDVLIVGLIEQTMASILCRSGIEVVAGAKGDALDVAKSYVSNTLTGVRSVCSIR